ncbi:MAG TPA: hypothetical protein DCS93_38760 [Microscillaceae bacterium]|nr:hypothetical protein [Microscillaceae bacterium]
MHQQTTPLKTTKLASLLGTWRGEGKGYFPPIDDFAYAEELIFETNQISDAIYYQQKTWLKGDNKPSHWEAGFIKPDPQEDNVFFINNAQGGGRVEVLRGTLTKNNGTFQLHWLSVLLQNDPRMISSERLWQFTDKQLAYTMKMATQNTPMHQQHLEASLLKYS